MSNTNAEILHRFIAAWNARDIDRVAALTHPDAELRPMRAQLEGKAYRGREGARQGAADLDEDWADLRMQVVELEEVEDRTFTRVRLTGQGKASGVDVDVVTGWIFRFRDGLIVYARAYSDPEHARDELGDETGNG
jgi:ketosteroid isomerase-like protein